MDSKAAFFCTLVLLLAMLFAAPAYASDDYAEALPAAAMDLSSLSDKGVSQEIIQQLAENGTADVIIMLKGGETGVHVSAEAAPSVLKEARSAALSRWKAAAASAQEKFLNKLSVSDWGTDAPSFDLKLKHKYETISAVSGNVTYAGLLKMLADPDVEGVYPDLKVYATLAQSVPLINADDVQHTQVAGKNITGAGQTVCVVDTGVDYTHSDLGGCFGSSCKVIAGIDYVNDDNNPMDDEGHGTHCAGIVASTDATYKGVAPGANIAAVKVLDSGGSGYFSDVISGIQWCYQRAAQYNISVISMSLGDGSSRSSYCNTYMSSMTTAINNAVAQGLIVAIASGNEGYSNGISFPACISSATSVGSTTKADAISSFTNIAPILDLLAPGSSITSTYLGGGFATMSGTSMATPHVAGAAALLKQNAQLHGGTITPAQIESALKSTGVMVSGYPRIDVYAAVMVGYCGNNIVEGSEQCDGGTCCNANCTFKISSTTCRASAGDCDLAETCTGSSGTCPADALRNSSTVCRAATGVCDNAETCTGSSPTCPSNSYLNSSTVCRASAGDCDAPETCTGSSSSCPSDSRRPAGYVCRAATDACDNAETCTGTSITCPADTLKSSSTVCRASAGDCDIAETCTGSSAACPADTLRSSSTVCRASAGVCDLAETCTGSSAACPSNSYLNSSTTCRASAGDCDNVETCTGSSAACPTNAYKTASTVCRAATDACDNAEKCTGSSSTCPSDTLMRSGTVCRAATDLCDNAETCTGASKVCPADTLKSNTTVCRAAVGNCDFAEICTGLSKVCPADIVVNSGIVCRASGGVCDVQETCTGASGACPADSKLPLGTVCRNASASNLCDLAEVCSGTSNSCPSDSRMRAGAVCRNATGPCDNAETCTGRTGSTTCPADTLKRSGTVCRASAGACDLAETCTGSSIDCPIDLKSTAVCRTSAGVCDIAESCNGSSNDCPANAFNSSADVCRPSTGTCDIAETCTGASAACPTNVFQAFGYSCTTPFCRPLDSTCNGLGNCIGDIKVCEDDGNSSTVEVCNEAIDSCQSIGTPIADLAITQADLVISNMAPLYRQTVSITATVRNRGTLTARNFKAGIYVNGALRYSPSINSLNPGSSYAVRYSWTAYSRGNVSIRAAADYTNVVTEASETNNIAEKRIVVV